MSDVVMTSDEFRLALALAAMEAPAKSAGLGEQWATLQEAQNVIALKWATQARLEEAYRLLDAAVSYVHKANPDLSRRIWVLLHPGRTPP